MFEILLILEMRKFKCVLEGISQTALWEFGTDVARSLKKQNITNLLFIITRTKSKISIIQF